MRVLVFGGGGMLGHKLVQVLGEVFDVWSTFHGDFKSFERFGIFDESRSIPYVEVTDAESVRKVIAFAKPDVVINAVGIIKQLSTSKDIVTTIKLNSLFPHYLAEISGEFNYKLITISTDCVFDGVKGNYTEDDTPNALDLYGQSKHFGEIEDENCLTIRTSIIGRELTTSHSLLEWFISNSGSSIKGYTNAIYSGFPTHIFADIIADLIANHRDLSGIFHISSDPINKFDLLKMINDAYELNIQIEPFGDFKIDRSLNSEKFRKLTGFVPMAWLEMIERMATDPTPYDSWK